MQILNEKSNLSAFQFDKKIFTKRLKFFILLYYYRKKVNLGALKGVKKMSQLKLSGFKMLEKAKYKKIDTKNLIEEYMKEAKVKEEKYGPAYTAKFIKYALRGISAQTGKETPKDIKTLDQLKDYLILKEGELRFPSYFLMFWAHFVTDKKFESFKEDLTQSMFKNVAQRVAEKDSDIKTKNLDLEEILAKLRKRAVDLEVAPLEFGYRMNNDGSIDLVHGGCPFFEGCEKSWEQNLLKKRDGRIMCGATIFVCQFLEIATRQGWDHAILEFDKTRCIARCFPVR